MDGSRQASRRVSTRHAESVRHKLGRLRSPGWRDGQLGVLNPTHRLARLLLDEHTRLSG